MVELSFHVTAVDADAEAAFPTLRLSLAVDNHTPALAVRSAVIDCQVRIDADQGAYSESEQARLLDVFGPPSGWHRSVGSLLWTNLVVTLGPIERGAEAVLRLGCGQDLSAAARLLHAVNAGDLPL